MRKALGYRVRWLRRRLHLRPRPHRVRFGSFARAAPISGQFGFDRGTPIDRIYIERFLETHRDDIRGMVLEPGDSRYTAKLGHDVDRLEIIAPLAFGDVTLVADLQHAPQIADGIFDCVLLPQTLQFIPDMRAALATAARILQPAGVVLATFSGISQISRTDAEHWGDYWRVTEQGAHVLADGLFETVEVESFGNVQAAIAFLHGVSAEELSASVWEHHDPNYPVTVALRASAPTSRQL